MTITTSTPRVIHQNIKDESAPLLNPAPLQVPQHCPLFYAMTSEGPDFAFINPGDIKRVFGERTFDPLSPFYNHVARAIEVTAEEGNAMMVKRVALPDSKKSSLVLVAEVMETGLGEGYMETTDGPITYDDLFPLERVPVGDDEEDTPYRPYASGATPGGFELRTSPTETACIVSYRTTTLAEWEAMAGGSNSVDLTQVDGTPHYLFAVMDLEFYCNGGLGNDWALDLTPNVGTDLNQSAFTANDAVSYNLRLAKRNALGNYQYEDHQYGSPVVELMFKPGAFNPTTKRSMGFSQVNELFRLDGTNTGSVSLPAPVNVTVNEIGLAQLLTVLNEYETQDINGFPAENAVAPLSTMPFDFDFLTAIRADGFPMANVYSTATVSGRTTARLHVPTTGDSDEQLGTSLRDLPFAGGDFIPLTKGADGDTSNTAFEAAVTVEVEDNYNAPELPLVNRPQFPFSDIYDTGFGMDLKNTLNKWLGYRDDVWYTKATNIAGEGPVDTFTDTQRLMTMHSSVSTYAESSVHGTPAIRANVICMGGILAQGNYTKSVPLTFNVLRRRCRFGGASSGRLNAVAAYDLYPNNLVTDFKTVFNPYLSPENKDTVWAARGNYVEHVDMNTMQMKSLQTIFTTGNSTLTGDINARIGTDIKKKLDILHSRVVDNSQLTNDQFAERCNEIFNELIEDGAIYANRVIIEIETTFSPEDEANGFSYTHNVYVYANVPKRVAVANIIYRRQV